MLCRLCFDVIRVFMAFAAIFCFGLLALGRQRHDNDLTRHTIAMEAELAAVDAATARMTAIERLAFDEDGEWACTRTSLTHPIHFKFKTNLCNTHHVQQRDHGKFKRVKDIARRGEGKRKRKSRAKDWAKPEPKASNDQRIVQSVVDSLVKRVDRDAKKEAVAQAKAQKVAAKKEAAAKKEVAAKGAVPKGKGGRRERKDSKGLQLKRLGGVDGIRRLRDEHKTLTAASKALLKQNNDFAGSENSALQKLRDLAMLALVKSDGTGLDEKWSIGVGYKPDASGGHVVAVAFTDAAKKKEAAKAAKKAAKKRKRTKPGGDS